MVRKTTSSRSTREGGTKETVKNDYKMSQFERFQQLLEGKISIEEFISSFSSEEDYCDFLADHTKGWNLYSYRPSVDRRTP